MLTVTEPKTANPDARPASSRDEAEIRRLIDAWSRALEARDLDGLVANYAPNVLLFGVKPPYKTEGVAAVRRLWEACLPYFPKSFESEYHGLSLTVGADVAFCHGLHHIKPLGEPGHPASQTWIRVTACYRKVGGRWLVAHEHVSIPFDCTTGQVSPIPDPGGPEGGAA